MRKCQICGKADGKLINSKKFGMVLCPRHYHAMYDDTLIPKYDITENTITLKYGHKNVTFIFDKEYKDIIERYKWKVYRRKDGKLYLRERLHYFISYVTGQPIDKLYVNDQFDNRKDKIVVCNRKLVKVPYYKNEFPHIIKGDQGYKVFFTKDGKRYSTKYFKIKAEVVYIWFLTENVLLYADEEIDRTIMEYFRQLSPIDMEKLNEYFVKRFAPSVYNRRLGLINYTHQIDRRRYQKYMKYLNIIKEAIQNDKNTAGV